MTEQQRKAGEEKEDKEPHRVFELIFLVSQIIIIVLYGFCTEYGEGVHPAFAATDTLTGQEAVRSYYPVY